uniref:CG9897 n=1 Tax=Drosophila melanogaster TaxID=7227 RepID=Q0GT26_DROME|nr:CG9897 [Drosophila melanogaster]ABG02684.1 CG9897 [Drosophila melanogaster]ABG02688.1 CG9897 [Drosophila melanogaster]ABG02689.1 CG9897 [Drosophila melanogaster]ABG02700.1 CG9897 [Drosophila melanogaster]
MLAPLILLQIVALPWLALGDQRIINGNTVNIKDAPWYASIIVNSKLKCGGAIISKNYILTAAKCVDGYSARSIQVRLGTSSCGTSGSIAGICKVKVHSQYSSWRFDNNLALLKTCELLNTTDEIKPIERANKVPDDNSRANRISSGIEEKCFQLPVQLHGTQVRILSQKQCAADWKVIPFYLLKGISDLTICTKSPGKGACSTDRGSPLVIDNKLVGILSRAGCSIKPDVYANILGHTNWLDSNTKD